MSYETHKADIAQATTKLELAKLAVADQKSLIEEIAQLNEPLLVTHEKAKLETLKIDQQTAELELNKAIAALKDAQAQRQHQEYLSSLAIAERIERANANALAYQQQLQEFENQQRSRAYQLSDLNTKLADVESRLAQVSTVRSPYAGTVRRIRWLEQSEAQSTPKLPYDLATLTQCQIENDPDLQLIAQAKNVEVSRLENLEASVDYQRDRRWTTWLTPNPIGILQNLFGGGDRQRAELQIRTTEAQADASRLNLIEADIRTEMRKKAIAAEIQADLDQLADLEAELMAEQKRLQLFEIYFQRGQGSPAEYLNFQNRLAQLTAEKEKLAATINDICEDNQ
ncbi:coiled-coil domain-containing protein [Picosynechococcus sp. PCC 11901]|uniref:hypothetical protein n=1 Tax=Picosynechococcus sp. PCC 11901 TaxID=2579791 RepID=UPI002107F2BF|nr:hypothetical protein [Picosynechococcus sp. PCC 11901]